MAKRTYTGWGVGILICGLLLGCANRQPLLKHDELLSFSLPFDVVYLRSIEAVQKHNDWDIARTDKEKGQIYVYNKKYSSYTDADRRNLMINIRRVDTKETTVQIDPRFQSVVGGDEILLLIKQYMEPEVERRRKRAELAAQSGR